MKRKKGFYSISAVAEMFSVHQQTIRLYEKEGLIAPKRSEGNTRLFSEEDVERLEEVIYLTHQLGINLAGVEMILKLKKQIKKMQRDMNKVFDSTQKELEKESEETQKRAKASAQRLFDIKSKDDSGKRKNKNMLIDATIAPKNKPEESENIWEIEYDE